MCRERISRSRTPKSCDRLVARPAWPKDSRGAEVLAALSKRVVTGWPGGARPSGGSISEPQGPQNTQCVREIPGWANQPCSPAGGHRGGIPLRAQEAQRREESNVAAARSETRAHGGQVPDFP